MHTSTGKHCEDKDNCGDGTSIKQKQRLLLEEGLVGYAKELNKKLLGKLHLGWLSWHFSPF